MEKKHHGYFAIRKIEGGVNRSFSFGTSLDGVRAWAIEASKEKKPEEAHEDEAENSSKSEGVNLRDLMERIIDTGLALQELAMSTRSVSSIFSAVISRVEIIDPIQEECSIIEDSNSFTIYGIAADRLNKIREGHRRLLRMEKGFDLLPSAVLLTAIATFDSLMSDIVRHMLSRHPERFDNMEKTMTISEIMKMNSFDDLKDRLLDDEIYQFSRGSHEEQVKQIEKWFGIKITDTWKRWPDFIEIFERRNLIAHGESTFTKRYVEICLKHGHKGSEKTLNTEIKLEFNYLAQSLDVLLEFALLALFSIWRKESRDEESQAFDAINHVCYRLILDERYRVPIRVIEYVLSLNKTNITEATRLMMIVNLASSHKHAGALDKCNETLSKVDWSAVSDNYRICVASLNEEHEEVCRLMDIVFKAGSVSKQDFREWPVFDFVRKDDRFKEKFEEIFSEPFDDPLTKSQKIESDEEIVGDIEKSENTLH
jgi:hypothetical protein